METDNDTKVVAKANIYYDFKGKSYKIGTISRKLILRKMLPYYVFDLDERAINKLKKKDPEVNATFIPGYDIDVYGYYADFIELPFFVEMRILDRDDADIQYYLDKFDMEVYDAFTFFLRNNGRWHDNFWVKQII